MLGPRPMSNTGFLKNILMDVHLPTTDGENLILPRYTQPEN